MEYGTKEYWAKFSELRKSAGNEYQLAERLTNELYRSTLPEPTVHVVDWTTVRGIEVLRCEDSKYVAQPISGRKNSKAFDIYDLDTNEYVCQLRKNEVRTWLAQRKRNEVAG